MLAFNKTHIIFIWKSEAQEHESYLWSHKSEGKR
jgi:hypothetical protein